MADLTPNAGMAAAAQQGLDWRAEGLGGDGLVEATISDARKMANREALSESKVRRMPAWFARHAVDLEAPQNDPDNKDYPGAGRVAWQLWGGDAGRSWADVKVRQLDEETRAHGQGGDHIICDIDGTLLNGAEPIVATIDFLNARPEPVCIVSGRMEAERADTVAALDAAGVEYYELYLNDTDAGTIEFKTLVAEALMAEYNIVLAVDSDEAARAAYNTLGITTLAPDDIEAAGAADEPEDEMNPFRHTAPVKLEVRESAMGAEYLTVTGYAAVFDQMSHDLGGFREIIQPGAFADVLGASPDVHLVIGHNMDLPLARTRNGTLELGEDIRGLKMWARIDSRLSYAKDLAVQLKSGLVDQMSFAFTIPEGGDTWTVDDAGSVTRTVNRIDGLYDVSVVAAGAYPQTDVQAVRALLRAAADKGLIPNNLLDTSQPETVGGDSVEQHAGGVVESDTGDRQAIQNLQAAKAKAKAAVHTHMKGL